MSEGSAVGGAEPRNDAQLSAEDLRKYLEQLRPLPAEQVLGDVFSSTLMAAQAKIGRHDARLLIDTAGLVLTHVRAYLSDESATQFEHVLDQLRMAQVQAEQDVTSKGQAEENDLPQAPTPPSGHPATRSEPVPPQQPSPASKLWVPGR